MDQIRKEYTKAILSEEHLVQDPIAQFKIWFDQTLESEVKEPTAMILSTVGLDSKPSSRVVLLKNIFNGEFIFFTNYLSRKGKELTTNPNACLLFFWDAMERQIRIEGKVNPLQSSESENYFYSRPLSSQIGAIISPQSQVISSRQELEDQIAYYEQHPEEIKKPKHWGGFKLSPDYFEFWQGRESRLHDRFCYLLENSEWNVSRLAP